MFPCLKIRQLSLLMVFWSFWVSNSHSSGCATLLCFSQFSVFVCATLLDVFQPVFIFFPCMFHPLIFSSLLYHPFISSIFHLHFRPFFNSVCAFIFTANEVLLFFPCCSYPLIFSSLLYHFFIYSIFHLHFCSFFSSVPVVLGFVAVHFFNCKRGFAFLSLLFFSCMFSFCSDACYVFVFVCFWSRF